MNRAEKSLREYYKHKIKYGTPPSSRMSSETMDLFGKFFAIVFVVLMVVFFMAMFAQGASDAEHIRETEERERELAEEKEAPIRSEILQRIEPETDTYFEYTTLGALREEHENVLAELGYECSWKDHSYGVSRSGYRTVYWIYDCYKQD